MKRKFSLTRFALIFATLSLPSTMHAAKIVDVWQQADQLPALKQFYFNLGTASPIQLQHLGLNTHTKLPQQFILKQRQRNNHTWHARFDQYYHGIPIWGSQLIIHQRQQTKLTGSIITGIAQDLPQLKPRLSANTASQIAQQQLQKLYPGHQLTSAQMLETKQYIYIADSEQSSQTTAQLVYRVKFFTRDLTAKRILNPLYLIDANQGKVLEFYDNLKRADVGTGPGGNDLTQKENDQLPRFKNAYQFGASMNDLPSLGLLPVMVLPNNLCRMESHIAQIRSWHNGMMNDYAFPITYKHERGLPVFTYLCIADEHYQNANDNGESPVITDKRTAFSPNNDAFYFTNQVYAMLGNYLPDIKYPWGVNLPVRVYTHANEFDNAGTFTVRAGANFPTQIVLGNGDSRFYPLTNSNTIAHESGHILTMYHSNLVYTGQAGAINEAYSDITGITFDAYINKLYPWYGFNWAIGSAITLPGHRTKALRYMDKPTADGHSIDHARKFKPRMNVHHASGVFNKAFYLAVATYGISIEDAFKYYSYANINYWTPRSTFDKASCGVIQAAVDLGHQDHVAKLKEAFAEVGVKCNTEPKHLHAIL